MSIVSIHTEHPVNEYLTFRQVLMQQQQKQIEEAVEKAQWDSVMKQAEDNGIRLSDFDTILQPIIDSCTKDSISGGEHC